MRDDTRKRERRRERERKRRGDRGRMRYGERDVGRETNIWSVRESQRERAREREKRECKGFYSDGRFKGTIERALCLFSLFSLLFLSL